jgi:hypothetical protein
MSRAYQAQRIDQYRLHPDVLGDLCSLHAAADICTGKISVERRVIFKNFNANLVPRPGLAARTWHLICKIYQQRNFNGGA